ncbi:MAG TPA: Flp family type IVb pilin [Oxalicibacterium sp.]|nr:Flp family type IVb pilin [Oxalicibacterium sp.]
MKKQILDFLKDEEGATAIEYALIAGLIAIGILSSLGGVRDAIIGLFGRIVTALTPTAAT